MLCLLNTLEGGWVGGGGGGGVVRGGWGGGGERGAPWKL